MLSQHKRVLIPVSYEYHFFFSQALIGYLFVQAEPNELKQYLIDNSIPAALVYDPLTKEAACMADSDLLWFKNVLIDPSSRFSILPNPLEYYAAGNEELICVSGPMKGYTGFVIRTHRDRKFVFAIGNRLTFAASLIKDSKFLSLSEYNNLPDSHKINLQS